MFMRPWISFIAPPNTRKEKKVHHDTTIYLEGPPKNVFDDYPRKRRLNGKAVDDPVMCVESPVTRKLCVVSTSCTVLIRNDSTSLWSRR